MILDSTIKTVIEKLQVQYKKEFGKDITQEEILTIVDSQFAAIAEVMKNIGIVKLDKLGKFLAKKGQIEAIKMKKGKF